MNYIGFPNYSSNTYFVYLDNTKTAYDLHSEYHKIPKKLQLGDQITFLIRFEYFYDESLSSINRKLHFEDEEGNQYECKLVGAYDLYIPSNSTFTFTYFEYTYTGDTTVNKGVVLSTSPIRDNEATSLIVPNGQWGQFVSDSLGSWGSYDYCKARELFASIGHQHPMKSYYEDGTFDITSSVLNNLTLGGVSVKLGHYWRNDYETHYKIELSSKLPVGTQNTLYLKDLPFSDYSEITRQCVYLQWAKSSSEDVQSPIPIRLCLRVSTKYKYIYLYNLFNKSSINDITSESSLCSGSDIATILSKGKLIIEFSVRND